MDDPGAPRLSPKLKLLPFSNNFHLQTEHVEYFRRWLGMHTNIKGDRSLVEWDYKRSGDRPYAFEWSLWATNQVEAMSKPMTIISDRAVVRGPSVKNHSIRDHILLSPNLSPITSLIIAYLAEVGEQESHQYHYLACFYLPDVPYLWGPRLASLLKGSDLVKYVLPSLEKNIAASYEEACEFAHTGYRGSYELYKDWAGHFDVWIRAYLIVLSRAQPVYSHALTECSIWVGTLVD
jgi:hypothetical protein